ncbi:MAG: tetratricopeptide repeat protein [Deltaproteobacteria bacterium]|nr:tetratricopeptide repeat protein [Deltaproteobacteria bacterium]MBW2661905.1 tetratricopeptide repeat protein [Deltaproteobacteria bacterium]
MAKKKKIARKELFNKPDEFITLTSRLLALAIKYKIQLSYGLSVLIVLVIAVSGFSYFSNKAETMAFDMLEQGIQKYTTIMKNDGQDKAYLAVEKDFQTILDNYSKKDAGKLVKVVYANICYNSGEFDKAIDLYNKALHDFKNNRLYKNIILSSLGYSYEGNKDYNSAIKYFEMIASGSDFVMKDEAFFNLGRIYAVMGKNEKSIAAFKKIISDYTDSIYIKLVKERVTG